MSEISRNVRNEPEVRRWDPRRWLPSLQQSTGELITYGNTAFPATGFKGDSVVREGQKEDFVARAREAKSEQWGWSGQRTEASSRLGAHAKRVSRTHPRVDTGWEWGPGRCASGQQTPWTGTGAASRSFA